MRRFPLSARVLAAMLLTGMFGLILPGAGRAAGPITVVASIKPVNSLVAGVMQGIGQPHLIVQGAASPHAYGLKPSDAAALERAKVVFWVGPGLETFLASSITTLARNAEVVELSTVPGLTLRPYRAGGVWEPDADASATEGDHGHKTIDMHLWLDPDNAKAMVQAIAAALIKADPASEGRYRANAAMMAQRLDRLTGEIESSLAGVKERPFVVFHDAFQYLDARFGLNNVGSVTVSPDRPPGAARLKEIHAKILALGARCVFTEPEFEPRLVKVVIEGTEAKTAVLDPLGADLADGPELYFQLMRRNAAALKDCLGETS